PWVTDRRALASTYPRMRIPRAIEVRFRVRLREGNGRLTELHLDLAHILAALTEMGPGEFFIVRAREPIHRHQDRALPSQTAQLIPVDRCRTACKLIHELEIVFPVDVGAIDKTLVRVVNEHQAPIECGVRAACTQELLPSRIRWEPTVMFDDRCFIGQRRETALL